MGAETDCQHVFAMTQLLPAPINCCRPCCRDRVRVIHDSGGGGGGTPVDVTVGTEDPNVAAVLPTNTAIWGYEYWQLGIGNTILAKWSWNVDNQVWE